MNKINSKSKSFLRYALLWFYTNWCIFMYYYTRKKVQRTHKYWLSPFIILNWHSAPNNLFSKWLIHRSLQWKAKFFVGGAQLFVGGGWAPSRPPLVTPLLHSFFISPWYTPSSVLVPTHSEKLWMLTYFFFIRFNRYQGMFLFSFSSIINVHTLYISSKYLQWQVRVTWLWKFWMFIVFSSSEYMRRYVLVT